MYTLKIKLFDNKEEFKDGKVRRLLTETYYCEVEKLMFKSYDRGSMSNFDDFIKDSSSARNNWFINPIDKPDRFLDVSYFDTNNEYKYIGILANNTQNAEVYIMQNGKTIDKYIV